MTLRQASLLVVKIGAIVASSGLIFALTFYGSIRMVVFGNETAVPDLRGQTSEQSAGLLESGGLTIETVEERFDPRVPAGAVISQTPAAGAVTKRNRKIRVVVSLGTEVLTVPDLTGQTERRAALEIERLGLQIGEVSRVSAAGAVDRVVAQDPMPGADIYRGDRVSLLLSRGPREPAYVMPDLNGRQVTEVEDALSTVGFRLSRTTYKDDWSPAGTVLRQFPLPGYPVTRRDPITVVVSRGPSV